MNLGAVARHLPQRLATGAYILHSGLEKWRGSPQQAEGVHRAAAGAYPFLADIPPTTFLRALAVGEIAVGSLLLLPSSRTALPEPPSRGSPAPSSACTCSRRSCTGRPACGRPPRASP